MKLPSGRLRHGPSTAPRVGPLIAHAAQGEETIGVELFVVEFGGGRLFRRRQGRPEILRHKDQIHGGALADGQLPARATPSNIWRAEACASARPKLLTAGTTSAARIPMMEITTSNSTSVNAADERTAFTDQSFQLNTLSLFTPSLAFWRSTERSGPADQTMTGELPS